ncbi:hypothetical protein EVAR_4241_1 [Eumeta japonica]|uniref:Uncharacterized protein n=1 Tax=Eumeta variegata TaxID=151549 RepID=A0A4C1TH16_EUMVA|nr:hypothetical protein EVAR_4241_1 [Eumeta japonica]
MEVVGTHGQRKGQMNKLITLVQGKVKEKRQTTKRWDDDIRKVAGITWSRVAREIRMDVGCVRPLSLFHSDESADGVEERSLVSRSRSHARLKRNATMNHSFSCVQQAFIAL